MDKQQIKQYPTPQQLDQMIASAMADHLEEIMPGAGGPDRVATETIMLALFKVAMEKMRTIMEQLGPPPMPQRQPTQRPN